MNIRDEWTYIRQQEVGDVVDAIAANLRHPIREWKRRRARRASAERWARELDAEVAAYIAEHPGTPAHWAYQCVLSQRMNASYAKILDVFRSPLAKEHFANWSKELPS